MGYVAHFKKPVELDAQFKPNYRNYDDLQRTIAQTKNELIVYIMDSKSEPVNYSSAKDMDLKVRLYYNLFEEQAKYYIKNMFDNTGEDTIWFRGWEYARESDFDKENIINNTVEQLMLLKYIVPTPDYFDDSEKFMQKLNAIHDEIDLSDIITDIINHEFMNFYKDFQEVDDEESDV